METSTLLAQELKDSKYGYISVSWGTLRSIDLASRFIDALETYANKTDTEAANILTEAKEEIPQEAWDDSYHEYWHTDSAGFLIHETLFDALNAICPEGYYFGASMGDGSDIGFWAVEVED